MAQPRRQTDDEEMDFSRLRRGGSILNGHTKWVVAVVSTGGVAALTWLVTQDRLRVERRLDEQQASIAVIMNRAESYTAKSDARWEEIQRSLVRIEDELKDGRKAKR